MSFEMVRAVKLFPLKLLFLQKLLFHVSEFTKMLRNLFKHEIIDMTQSVNGIRS